MFAVNIQKISYYVNPDGQVMYDGDGTMPHVPDLGELGVLFGTLTRDFTTADGVRSLHFNEGHDSWILTFVPV